eukprot:CAMPEP_0171102672 /NCGR_PEP_ID=MMETSP0766_2-20121228/58446_1 /TAXON_ID=439317 /ORGANISM="Gambierdiscus australes, Strain CAWD 149" /LENGTH=169 /DNA_ID=CAMNT_0011563005 /DNA_START=54 /DNA_END=563 /DNA_ORIENTATION=+
MALRPSATCVTVCAARSRRLRAPKAPRLAALLVALGHAARAWTTPSAWSRAVFRFSATAEEELRAVALQGRGTGRMPTATERAMLELPVVVASVSRHSRAGPPELLGDGTANVDLYTAEKLRLQWVEARLLKLNAQHEEVVAKQQTLAEQRKAIAGLKAAIASRPRSSP